MPAACPQDHALPLSKHAFNSLKLLRTCLACVHFASAAVHVHHLQYHLPAAQLHMHMHLPRQLLQHHPRDPPSFMHPRYIDLTTVLKLTITLYVRVAREHAASTNTGLQRSDCLLEDANARLHITAGTGDSVITNKCSSTSMRGCHCGSIECPTPMAPACCRTRCSSCMQSPVAVICDVHYNNGPQTQPPAIKLQHTPACAAHNAMKLLPGELRMVRISSM